MGSELAESDGVTLDAIDGVFVVELSVGCWTGKAVGETVGLLEVGVSCGRSVGERLGDSDGGTLFSVLGEYVGASVVLGIVLSLYEASNL